MGCIPQVSAPRGLDWGTFQVVLYLRRGLFQTLDR